MRALLWTFTITIGWIGACSTISIRQTLDSFPVPTVRLDTFDSKDPVAADAWLEKKFVAHPTEPMRHLVRYRQAALWSPIDPLKACTLWGEVAGSKLFPLREVAQVRAMETCPPGREWADRLEPSTQDIKAPWLRETLVRALLARAEATGNKKLELSLSLELATHEKLQRDRIRRLERAMSLAVELGDETLRQDAEERLRISAPRFIPEPLPNQWFSVANDFRQAREFAKAREFYSRIVDSFETSDTEKLRALDGIRQTYKLEKDTPAFLQATKEFASFAKRRFLDTAKGPGAKGPLAKQLLTKYLETQLTLARAIWTEDSPKEATAILKKAERDIKKRIPVFESIFTRARIEEEAGRFKEVAKLLEPIDVTKIPERSLRQKILWYRAWNLKRVGKAPEAITALERLLTEDDTPSMIARDRFWLGKLLTASGDVDRAIPHFEWLTTNDPLGYYGLLAFRELKRPLPPLVGVELREPASVEPAPPENEPTASSANRPLALPPIDNLTAEWLIAVGENELARKFLDSVSYGIRSSLDEARALDLLHLYARAGSYQSLFARLYELAPEVRARILAEKPDVLFPRPWYPLVKESSEKFSVKHELIYSIMRQESSFNPLARSPADAFGLMQLIPEAAKRANKTANVDYKAPEDMYRPEINIPLGTAFLQELLDANNSSFILATASYNASEKAIRGWMRTRFRGDTLEFIEDIPYEETRNYIKLVMRNFVFYSRLNAGQTPIDFPEWCLEGLHTAKP